MDKTLKLVPYDPAWPRDFDAERNRIAAVAGVLALRIDHHGSTSIPGLAAKPIIDIQISVERLHPIEAYASQLAELGTFTYPTQTMRSVPSSIGLSLGHTRIMCTSFRRGEKRSSARWHFGITCANTPRLHENTRN